MFCLPELQSLDNTDHRGLGNLSSALLIASWHNLVACCFPTSLSLLYLLSLPPHQNAFIAAIPETGGKERRSWVYTWATIFPALSAFSSMLCRTLIHWINSSTPQPLHRLLPPSSDCFLFCLWCIMKNSTSKFLCNHHYWSLISWLIVLITYITACFWPKTLSSNDCLPIISQTQICYSLSDSTRLSFMLFYF